MTPIDANTTGKPNENTAPYPSCARACSDSFQRSQLLLPDERRLRRVEGLHRRRREDQPRRDRSVSCDTNIVCGSAQTRTENMPTGTKATQPGGRLIVGTYKSRWHGHAFVLLFRRVAHDCIGPADDLYLKVGTNSPRQGRRTCRLGWEKVRAQGHGSNPHLSALNCQNFLTERLLCSTCKQPRTRKP